MTRPQASFGDFSTNIALQLASKVGKPPREIAEKIAEHLSSDEIAKTEVAGPGFINITLSDKALFNLLKVELPKTLLGKLYLIEYSDPNPFKPLHAGHLYTTLVGDSIARLVENAGADVKRLNFGGDVGLHAAKCMWGMIESLKGINPDKLDEINERDRAVWMGDCYVAGNNAYEDNEAAKAEITSLNRQIYALHETSDHDSAIARLYWTTRQWSYKYFEELYRQLQVRPFDRFIPESEVTPLGLSTVEEQLKQGVYQKSDGAVIFDGEKYGLHSRVFINSEGLPTYEAKDVGLSLTKWQQYPNFDHSIIITANEQAQYMQVVLKSLEQFEPEPAHRTRHITHGVVKLLGGVKMSSRRGNIISAMDILDSARKAVSQTGKSSDESIVLAAVKYAFARNRIGGDIIYDPAESVALEGNSGPYLQYAHARARSILGKAQQQVADKQPNPTLQFTDLLPDERLILRKTSEFGDALALATAELMPHHICTYLYELAQEFNRFYEKNRVIGDEREQLRIWIVEMYAKRLESGLALLGIHAPEKM